MVPLRAAIRRLFGEDDGPTAVEYAVMLSLIMAVCMAAVRVLGTNTSSAFSRAANSLASSGGSGGGGGNNGGGNNGGGNNTGSGNNGGGNNTGS
jgi:Flp pilus assembly pilin Flp